MSEGRGEEDAPSSTRIHLLRHGRVAAEWRGRVYGNLDAPLSPEGEAEARRAANALAEVPLACVASSGLGRAEFGAAILRADRGLERRDERDLAEIHRGEWQGLDPSEIELRWPGGWRGWWLRPQAERPPGGESLTDLSRRVLPCLERLADEFPGEQIAVVAHSWVIRVSATHALGLPIGAATRLELPPASLAVLDWPARSAGRSRRPVLAGFCVDRPPERRDGWFRGPRR